MALDLAVCSRARLARDARFDGKFFIAVLSTKIYCRPICRSRTSGEARVRYYPTAAAAAEAGFRPCLRCRPECSPGSPAWAGTRNSVSRALQLIYEGGLENGGVEHLAEHLGMGARHLRRLFVKHLGATPSAVAQTRRLNFAKKLIDETRLRMSEVALASGFASVRRFNATIQQVYHRTPTQVRCLARQMGQQPANRAAKQAAEEPENCYRFHLDFRPPYKWGCVLAFLGGSAVPGVEAVKDGRYLRTISVRNGCGYFEVSLDRLKNALAVRIQIKDARSLFFITEKVRAMFDLNADWEAIAKMLRSDRMLGRALETEAGVRVPGCWSGYELTTMAILAQGNADAAASLAGKIARYFGQRFAGPDGLTHVFPTSEVLADANLTNIGLPKTSAEAIRGLARAVCDQQITFDGMADSEDFRERLCEIPGIERQTAEYAAMRALRDPDAFPTGKLMFGESAARNVIRRLEQRSQSWRPWRAYAAMLQWQVDNRRSADTAEAVAPLGFAAQAMSSRTGKEASVSARARGLGA